MLYVVILLALGGWQANSVAKADFKTAIKAVDGFDFFH